MKRKAVMTAILLMAASTCFGQKWGISTNLIDYANFITLNGELSFSVHKNWSVVIAGKYNPFIYNISRSASQQLQNKKATVSAGTRYWPFFVYSGFYYGGKLQWSRYNSGGIFSERTYEGDALGAGFSFGYSLLVTRHLNIEFGLGLWTGMTRYKEYASPRCGRKEGEGLKWFIAPNDVTINLLFNF